MQKTYVVIGAGISGLVTAYYLKKKIQTDNLDAKLIVLEKERETGGNIKTVIEDGFIFEGGPRGFLAGGRRTLELCKELDLWDKLEVSSDASRFRFIWKNSKLNQLPAKPFDIFKSEVIGFSEVKTILSEYFKRNEALTKDESVYDFFSRRFNNSIMENFVELMITGIYAGDPKKLSVQSLFPKARQMESEYGSIIKGFLKNKKKKNNEDFSEEIMSIKKSKLVSFKEGMRVLSDGITQYLGDSVLADVQIDGIDYKESQYKINYQQKVQSHSIAADSIFMAPPSFITADLLKGFAPNVSAKLKEIEYAPIHVAGLAYKKAAHSYNGFGFLAPRKENIDILGCIWNEKVFPSYAPDNTSNLTAMYGGACHPEMKNWDEKQLYESTERDLKLTMNIEAKADIYKSFLYEKGIPQYNIGHQDRIDGIMKDLENYPGLYLIGNYMKGVGINDCVNNAYDLVKGLK